MRKILTICALFLSYSPCLQAEYRAFLLQIKSKTGELKRSFPSTLDPQQYSGYFPLAADEKISYVETWMCRGRTGSFQKICDNPKAQPLAPGQTVDAERSPANTTGAVVPVDAAGSNAAPQVPVPAPPSKADTTNSPKPPANP